MLLLKAALELTNNGAVWVQSTRQAREHALEVANRRVERVHSMDQADGGGKAGHARAFQETLGRVHFVPSAL